MVEISISKPMLGNAEKQAIADVIDSGILAQGPRVLEFEKQFANYCGTNHAIASSSGTTAIHLALLANNVCPGDEVITPAPYFVEYGFYVDNHGGVLKTVATKSDFTLDVRAIQGAITPRTKAVLINSPNNPSGQVYSSESLVDLGVLLREEGRRLKRTLYLISDEPYRKITFDGANVPSIFSCYAESMIATSYSKDVSIPGERIGFLAVSPQATYKEDLLAGMALANRILGYVNAPGLMQRAIQSLQGVAVDTTIYQKKRDLLCDGLSECGYEYIKPKGAFYLFPKSVVPDDVAFVKALQEELILTVPGSGFGTPGYFRIAFCVDDDTITRALPGFERVLKQF